ncbi:hypothetical protein [Bradyrhizobium diazoefficiens]|uniref:hypothetical protein n=1 Tax=Bradyrhizobium diazoefficiens TaxID=1355477 RepID=UPI002714730B|nr:hypothetical protein [Bradyrhizobium diazoefficiens]WLB38378.1 hypothetical protein QIH78_00575 [Bradyrhizobium diazoefficiens]
MENAAPCFLCDTSTDLTYLTSDNFVALVGLGPLVQDYSVIASKAHSKSMADVSQALWDERRDFVTAIRDELERQHGSCVITEHGRMAVCDDYEHDTHCFHAHFLVFPGSQDISGQATSYFSSVQSFDDLDSSLKHAGELEEYLLVSPRPDRFNIFAGPLHVPRQLARYLVGWQTGNAHMADWKARPDRVQAQSMARRLRSTFGGFDADTGKD